MTQSMTGYERKAWEKLVAAEKSHRNSFRARASDKVAVTLATAGKVVKKIPGSEKVTDAFDATIKVALNGAATAVFMPAIASVSIKRRSKKLLKRHPEIGDAIPFVVLDLEDLDKGRPRQIVPLANAATSAGASLAITGAEVSTTVSGGATAGVVVIAIAGDIALSLALLGRSVAEVAVHYGFDPSEPEEEVFFLGVLSYSTAGSLEGKTAALAALSRLSQQMMRGATWKELEKDVIVRVVEAVFTKIGTNLTHKRLAQIVPVLGGVISAGLSYDMQSRALRDATRIYRARYLAEKHDLSFDEWVDKAMSDATTQSYEHSSTEDAPVDVEAELQSAIDQLSSDRDRPTRSDDGIGEPFPESDEDRPGEAAQAR